MSYLRKQVSFLNLFPLKNKEVLDFSSIQYATDLTNFLFLLSLASYFRSNFSRNALIKSPFGLKRYKTPISLNSNYYLVAKASMRPFSSAFVENVFFSCFFLHLASITQSSQYSLEKNVLQDCRHQSSSWPPSMTLLCSSVGDRDRDRLRKGRSSPGWSGSKIGTIRRRS